ncbi:hypothetical protein [Ramlibacter sp.]|uniref:hypothetical protein n=1 Tax=Ramlibacter sp. TaxID=1917967 RepID=UPI003D13836D
MGFKFSKDETFTAKVKVPVANKEGGYDVSDYVAVFRHPDAEELKTLRATANDELVLGSVSDGTQERKGAVLIGWQMRDDDTKQEVPFNDETLAAAVKVPNFVMFTAMAFWEQVNGARAKNL